MQPRALQQIRQAIAPALQKFHAAMPAGRVSRNAAILLVNTAAVNLVTLPFVAFLARRLGADQFGAYGVAFAFANIYLLLIDMGSSTPVSYTHLTLPTIYSV